MMGASANTFPEHLPLVCQDITTAAGTVRLTLCPACDRPRCPRCRTAFGVFFPQARQQCPTCGTVSG